MHISPLVMIRCRIRKRDVSLQARKIWAPGSMLKCFNLNVKLIYTAKIEFRRQESVVRRSHMEGFDSGLNYAIVK